MIAKFHNFLSDGKEYHFDMKIDAVNEAKLMVENDNSLTVKTYEYTGTLRQELKHGLKRTDTYDLKVTTWHNQSDVNRKIGVLQKFR